MKTLYYYGVLHALRKKSDNFKVFFHNQNHSDYDMRCYVEKTIETMGLKPYETYKVDYEDGDYNPPKKTAIGVFTDILNKIVDEIVISLSPMGEPIPVKLRLLEASILFEKNMFLDCDEKQNYKNQFLNTSQKIHRKICIKNL